jgi:hypothetical protein
MNRWCLPLAFLLAGSVGTASADYVVLIANLGEKPVTTLPKPPGAGMIGGPAGGMIGGPPGGGMIGGPPGGGMIGGPPSGAYGGSRGPTPGGGITGSSGGAYGMVGGPPGMGALGGSAGGIGLPGDPMGDMGYPYESPTDAAVDPYTIVAVVEVDTLTRGAQRYFKDPKYMALGKTVVVKHKWGRATLLPRFGTVKAVFLETPDGKPMATVQKRYKKKHDEVFREDDPKPGALLELARWALAHGMVDECAEVMDRLVEKDKTSAVAVAYLDVRKGLAAPLTGRPEVPRLLARLLSGYRLTTTKDRHYAILHDSPTPDVSEVQTELDQLETAMRGFYYWWALRSVALPVPKEHLLAVLTSRPEDFQRYHDVFTSGSIVADGFYARRENVVVLSRQRRDETYNVLQTMSAPYWGSKNFIKEKMLQGDLRRGGPRDASAVDRYHAQIMALLLKVLDEEARKTRITHEVSCQLVFASGLLPANVHIPEWIQFGMGSFFETSPQSPWPGIGTPSVYYLPRFRLLQKEKKLEKSAYETMFKVITDGYFRDPRLARAVGSGDEPIKAKFTKEQRAAQLEARATAWSLTYFLVETRRKQLQDYFKELSKLPRDVPLNQKVLLETFARSFGALGPDRKVDQRKLEGLANQWDSYMSGLPLEAENLVTQLRKYYEEAKAKRKPKPKPGRGPGGIFPGGGFPGGAGYPGGGGTGYPGGIGPRPGGP